MKGRGSESFSPHLIKTSDIDPQFLADPSGLISDRSEIDHAVNKAQIPFQYIPKNAKTGGGGGGSGEDVVNQLLALN